MQSTNRSGTVTRARIADIEALRAIAILFVMVEHVDFNLLFHPDKLQWFLQWGQLWPGVDLFLVISGFLVSGDLVHRLTAGTGWRDYAAVARRFWLRRAWRLWPTAWLWLAIILVGSLIWSDPPFLGPAVTNARSAMAGIFFYANYRSAVLLGGPYGASFAYWSLSLEEQFYLILPLAIFLLGGRLPVALLLGIVLQFPLAHGRLYSFFRSDALLWGVALALWYQRPSYARCEPTFLKSRALGAAFLLTCLAAMFHLAGRGNTSPPFVIGTIAILSALLVWAASYDRGYFCPQWARPFAFWAGSRAYALYVAHIPVFLGSAAIAHSVFTPHDHLFSGAGNLYALAIMVPSMLVAVEITHRCVEQPLRRLGARLATSGS